MTTLVASAARAVSGNSGALGASVLPQMPLIERARFVLKVTAAAAAAGDTLDVYVQRTIDGGTTWDDFVHFTQVLGNGGVKTFIAEWTKEVTPETELRAPADGALAAGVLQGGPFGEDIRVKWVIAGSTPNFTFTVLAETVKSRL